MTGLKLQVKINNNDELKQAHDLLLCMGYSTYNEESLSVWASQGKPIFLKTNCFRENKDKIDWSFFATEVGFKEITLPELRAMVNQDQDEPFLTPETTLNDQYAEIEQVRQMEIHGTAKAAQTVGGVDATLRERQTQYGCYEDVAQVTQQILAALRIGNYDKLPAPMKESLHMIASKMARIVNGDPEYFDNWHDIGGYAKLIEKLIKGE